MQKKIVYKSDITGDPKDYLYFIGTLHSNNGKDYLMIPDISTTYKVEVVEGDILLALDLYEMWLYGNEDGIHCLRKIKSDLFESFMVICNLAMQKVHLNEGDELVEMYNFALRKNSVTNTLLQFE